MLRQALHRLPPIAGRGGLRWTGVGLRATALPAPTPGGVFVGPVARMARTAVLDVLSADHARTARAKVALGPAALIARAQPIVAEDDVRLPPGREQTWGSRPRSGQGACGRTGPTTSRSTRALASA